MITTKSGNGRTTACCGPTRVSTPPPLKVACPTCSDPGRTVNNITVKSLVADEYRLQVGDDDYNICLNPQCNVVYYNGTKPPLTKSHMTIRIGFKEAEGRIPICYCYDLIAQDILEEMRRNSEVRSFADVAAIFGMNNCQCERKHPLGGNCACAADVGRLVREWLKEPTSRQADLQRSDIRTIYLFEKSEATCGQASSGPLVSFLKRKFRDTAQVKAFKIGNLEALIPAPVELLQRLCQEGLDCLPALVVDGLVVFQKHLPNFMDAVECINSCQSTGHTKTV